MRLLLLIISALHYTVATDDTCTPLSPCTVQNYSVPAFDGSTGVGSFADFDLTLMMISTTVPHFLNVTQGCVVGGSTATLTLNDTISNTIYTCQYENNGNSILPNNQPSCPQARDPSLAPFLYYTLQSCSPTLQSDQILMPNNLDLQVPASNNYPQTIIQIMAQLQQISTSNNQCYSLNSGQTQSDCVTTTTTIDAVSTSTPTSSSGAQLNTTMIAIVASVSALVCIAILVGYLIYRRKIQAKKIPPIQDSQVIPTYSVDQSQDIAQSVEQSNEELERRNTIDSRRKSLLEYTRTSSLHESVHRSRSRVASITTNLADQTLCNEQATIALPGFLKLDFNKDLREIEILNEGGAAIVYISELLNENIINKFGLQQAAVKVPKIMHNWTEEQAKSCFTQEVSIMWSLNSSPFVVQLLGYSLEPMAIVTRCYDCNLQEYLHDRNQALTSTIAFKFSYEVGEAIKAVHAVGIAHRDIKSANILLRLHSSRKPDVPIAVLTDFGIAEIIGNAAITISGQKFANVNGLSPKYAAPEVWLRARASEDELSSELLSGTNSKKGDIYAYGVVLWEIMHRKDAWADMSNMDVKTNVLNSMRPQFDTFADGIIYAELIKIIEIAWAQDHNDRFTAYEVVEQLKTLYHQIEVSETEEKMRLIAEAGIYFETEDDLGPRGRSMSRLSANNLTLRASARVGSQDGNTVEASPSERSRSRLNSAVPKGRGSMTVGPTISASLGIVNEEDDSKDIRTNAFIE